MGLQKKIKLNQKAPNFALKDHLEKSFHLSGNNGKRILLSFHPLAWTSVCAKQMKMLDEHKEEFDKLNTIAVGISVDSVPSKTAWAESLGIKNTSLLSDFWPHGKVASLYGIFRKNDGISGRANFIINEKQEVIFAKIYDIEQLPDIQEVIDFLKNN